MTRPPHAAPHERRGGNATGLGRVLVEYVGSHVLALIAEWGALIALLVYAFEQSGSRAVGIASFSSLVPYVLLASSTARAAQRYPAAIVRLLSMIGQAVGFGAAAAVALAHGSVWLVVAGNAIGFTAATGMRPAGAVLLPALVRTSRELTTANVWVGYADSASLMLGPATATLLLGLHGPGAALAGCAVLSVVSAGLATPALRTGPPPAHSADDARPVRSGSLVRRIVTGPFADVLRIARRGSSRAVLVVAWAEFMLVGASDVIWVVVAGEHIDVGDAGGAVLSAMFGAGSFLSALVMGRAARRSHLAPAMLVALALVGVACAALGAATTLSVALIVVPVMGLCRALLDLLARVLLQRSAPPSELASVFGAIETISGVGLLAGSLLAQVLIAASGAAAALLGLAVTFVVVLAAVARSLRSADDAADVPVVEMTLLRQYPAFAQLPVFELEAVARSATEMPVTDGTVVIRAGDAGDRFYAIVDGTFDVVRDDRHVGRIGRGNGFGEVALLADVPRTATVTAVGQGTLLAIAREPFLLAVTGHQPAHDAAWTVIREWGVER
jgi:MFS family permease